MKQLPEYFKMVQERVNACLEQKLNDLPDTPAVLKEAMRHALLLGGKRARPVLVFMTGQAFGASKKQLDYVAAAIECIHAYSLVHDDMPEMDNDLLRRNQPTVHAKFGAATALLTGDTLQALAFDLLTDVTCDLSGDVKGRMCACLAKASGFVGMCGGQALDLAAEEQSLTQAELEELHSKKTGALITCALQLGYMAGRYQAAYDAKQTDAIASALGFVEQPQIGRDLDVITAFGQKVGLAFQVWDDVLDVAGDTATLGKTVGSDEAHHKSTYVSLLGLEEAKAYAQKLAKEACTLIKGLDVDTTLLEQFAHFCVERDH